MKGGTHVRNPPCFRPAFALLLLGLASLAQAQDPAAVKELAKLDAQIKRKPDTVAFGITSEGGHRNLGMLEPDTAYKDIRAACRSALRRSL